MNKKKIISSLTIAGMIASAGMSNVFAADEDTKTPALGEFTKLVEGSNVTAIPFKIQSESDRVTGKDLMIAYPGKIISVEANQVLKTGDVVRIGGQPRTIVIYGDVNRDGAVDIFDVTKVVDNVVNDSKKLTGVELAAADLNRDGVADIYDITKIVSAISGETYASMNVTLPQEEVAKVSNLEIPSSTEIDVKFDYNNASDYTFTVTDDKTGKNLTVTKAEYDSKEKKTKLTLGSHLIDISTDRNQTYTLTVKDKTGKVVSENKNFKYTKLNEIESALIDTDDADKQIINTNNVNNLAVKVRLAAENDDTTDKSNLVPATVSVTLIDTAKREVIGTATLPAGSNEVVVNNFSGVDKLENGTIKVKVEIIDESGNKVVYESQDRSATQGNTNGTHFRKDTAKLEIGNVEATRSGNVISGVKVNMIGNDNLAKAYVMVLPTSSAAPTKDAIVDEDNEREIENSNNNKGVITLGKEKNLTDNNASTTGYTVYVVVENENGVMSDVAKTDLPVAIPSTTLEKVTAIKAIKTQPGWFEWKDDENKDASKISGYLVKLYSSNSSRMSSPILVATQTISNSNTKNVNFLQTIKDYVQEHNKTGDNERSNIYFSIEVISLANGTSVKSSESTSLSSRGDNYVDGEEYVYTAERLATPVINGNALTFNDDNHLILGYVPADLGDFAGFDVNIYKYDENGVPAFSPCATGTASREKKECDLTSALAGQEEGKYLVKIVAISSGSTKADSLESEGIDIYYVKAPEVTLKALSSSSFEAKYYNIDDIQVKNEPNATKGFKYELIIKKVAASGTKSDFRTISSASDTAPTLKYDADNSLYTALVNGVDSETKYEAYVTVIYGSKPIAKSETKQITMDKAPITTNGEAYKVVTDKSSVGNRSIYFDTDDEKLYIDNATTSVSTTMSNYNEVVDLVKKLKLNDTITIGNDGKVSEVKVVNVEEVDFGTILKDGTLKVEATNTTATNRPIVNGTFDKVEVKSNVEFIGNVQNDITLLENNLNVKVPAKSIVTIDKENASAINTDINTATINDITLSNIIDNNDKKIKVTAIDNGISIGDLAKTNNNSNNPYANYLKVSVSKDAVVEFTGNQGKGVTLANNSTKDDEILTVKSENPVDLLIDKDSKTVDIEGAKYKECKINNHAEVAFMTKKTLKFGSVDYTINPTERVTVKHDKPTDSSSDRNITITGNAIITFAVASDAYAKPTLDNEGKLVRNNTIATGDTKKLGVDNNNVATNNLEVTASQAGATYYVNTDHEVVLETESVGGVITIHIFN